VIPAFVHVTQVVGYFHRSFDEEAQPMAENAEAHVPDFDISRPTIARVYDAILGGKDNFAPDREGAAAYMKYVPNAKDVALDNREGLRKGVEYMASQGIDQFLDIGAGLPTMENTHQIAQRINPDAKVVYVDNDPIVLAHGRALLATNDTTTIVTADLRDPQSILGHEEVKGMLDFTRPRVLMDACPSGSYLLITDFVDTGEPLQKAIEQAGLESLGNGWIRTPERIEEHFVGLPLVEPGMDFIPRWFPGEPDRELIPAEDLEPWHRIMYGGIAKKP
jgi:hypothetical protein